jgi:hypothetical protein
LYGQASVHLPSQPVKFITGAGYAFPCSPDVAYNSTCVFFTILHIQGRGVLTQVFKRRIHSPRIQLLQHRIPLSTHLSP